jgi:isopentenyl-diphosphate Delta-isomerase
MTEYLDVVDDDDKVIGKATREECHRKNLPHRSVMFFIFDKQGRILVNKRSSKKEFFGGLHSIVLGGHISSGETYDDTVVREAMEEAQVNGKPFRMGYFKKRLPQEMENVTVFGFITEKKPKLLKEEIESGEFLTVAEAKERMKKMRFLPETPQLMALLEEHLNRH